MGIFPTGAGARQLRERFAALLGEANATSDGTVVIFEPRCSICTHPHREAIEQAVGPAGLSQVKAAEQYGVSRAALQRHLERHLRAGAAVGG